MSAVSNVAELLLLDVLPGSGPRLREQLRAQLVEAMDQGRLQPGDRLPPSRQLAHDLGIARGTVVDVYDQLVHDGMLIARVGSGTTVAEQRRPPPPGSAPPARQPDFDLRPGGPDLAAFPRLAWGTATTHVLRTLPDAELGYLPPWGSETLRASLSRYLARTRHVVAGPDDLVITSGVTQALTLSCRVLRERGHRLLAVEDPSNAVQRDVLGRYGLTMVNVPVDEDGLDVEALGRTRARAVLVTPAHQYPTGVALAAERRAALFAWARDCDGLVIEDDYDAEFQRPRGPVRSLQGDAPGLVAHASSVSKTLAPGLRLGWLIPPPALLDDVVRAKRDDDFGTSTLPQQVLARLIDTGGYDRHLRRQRATYTMRRQRLVDALAGALPDWRVRGSTAGLHLWLEPPAAIDEPAVVRAAARRGVLVLGMCSMTRTTAHAGLVLGYARLRTGQAEEVAVRLAAAVQDATAERAATAGPEVSRTGATGIDYFP